MDNFEWNPGYRMRFGLNFIDYPSGCRRILKDTAKYYGEVIRSNGECLPKMPLNF